MLFFAKQKSNILTLTLWLASFFYASADDTIAVSQVLEQGWFHLPQQERIYESDRGLAIHEFLSAADLDTFISVHPNKDYWTRFTLYNDQPDSQWVYVNLGHPNEKIVLYRLEHTTVKDTAIAGYLVPYTKRNLPRNPINFELVLAPGQTYEGVLQITGLTNKLPWVNPYLVSDFRFLLDIKVMSPDYHKYTGLSMIFQGAVWIMMLYMFLLYFQNNRDATFLTYAFYLFTVMLYLIFKIAGDGPYFFALPNMPFLRYTLNEPLQFAMSIAYNLFAIKFLNIKRQKKWLYRAMVWINWVYALYAVAITLYFIITKDVLLVNTLFGPTRIFMLVTGVALIIISAVRLKGPLVRYLVAGSTFFLLGNLTAIAFTILSAKGISYSLLSGLAPISFTQIGVFLEMICFSLGVGKKIQMDNNEKEEIKDAYIAQLVENEKLNIKINQELEEKIADRTDEVLQKNKELEREREHKMRIEFERQLVESEMNSLRLQMNPHFIFNSLNSIRYFILKQDSDKAVDYITSFSKLLRMILHHSKQNYITLEEELESLRLYMMFESERFAEKFQYSITIDERIEPAQTKIQPLLIQPFVENAIWHGLMHRDEAGHIDITIKTLDKGLLKIVIEDDGIGRTKAAALKSKTHGNQKSYGMQITKSRLDAMNKISGGRGGFEVEDLFDENGKPAGTRVILVIKTKLYESTNY